MASAITTDWTDIDHWWADHVAEISPDFKQANELIGRLNAAWDTNDSPFTKDPLSENWESETPMTGPLRTNQEENWSQWLAHVLRSSDGTTTQLLFDLPAPKSPTGVSREVHVSSEEYNDRRVDLTVEFPDRACSIEVKIDDIHYEKSPEAAYLAKQNAAHDKPWNHYLLVPQRNQPAVMDAFGDDIDQSRDSNPTISSNRFVDVDILWWGDVATVLRRTLPEETNQFWQASAFLFIALIEQKVMKFRSQPAIGPLIDGTTVPDIASTRGVDIDDQIEYLTNLVGGETHE